MRFTYVVWAFHRCPVLREIPEWSNNWSESTALSIERKQSRCSRTRSVSPTYNIGDIVQRTATDSDSEQHKWIQCRTTVVLQRIVNGRKICSTNSHVGVQDSSITNLLSPTPHSWCRHPVDRDYFQLSDWSLESRRESFFSIFSFSWHPTGFIMCPRSELQRAVLCVPKEREGDIIEEQFETERWSLTKGNEAMLNGQMDLKIPGGT